MCGRSWRCSRRGASHGHQEIPSVVTISWRSECGTQSTITFSLGAILTRSPSKYPMPGSPGQPPAYKFLSALTALAVLAVLTALAALAVPAILAILAVLAVVTVRRGCRGCPCPLSPEVLPFLAGMPTWLLARTVLRPSVPAPKSMNMVLAVAVSSSPRLPGTPRGVVMMKPHDCPHVFDLSSGMCIQHCVPHGKGRKYLPCLDLGQSQPLRPS